MPYKWEKKGLKLGKFDRRRNKLTSEDKALIKKKFEQGVAIRAIAREYQGKCSRSWLQIYLNPKRAEAVKKRIKEHWRDYSDRKKLTKAIKKWRNYKQKLFIKKII